MTPPNDEWSIWYELCKEMKLERDALIIYEFFKKKMNVKEK